MGREVLARLDPKPGEIMLDATVGLGGHASLILEGLSAGGRLIGVDRDPNALGLAAQGLSRWKDQVQLHHGRFSDLREALRSSDVSEEGGLHGILLDLGVSSFQLDTAERGFSFGRAGPLDMRMDPSTGESAASLLARASVEEIAQILREYGEETAARRIARAIDRRRKQGRLATTSDLAEAVEGVLPRRGRRTHPATRTFQAVRIAVNDELTELRRALQEMDRFLAPGGRVVVLSYHSLEDRLVKTSFREREAQGVFQLNAEDPVVPRDDEIVQNPRARSARLRSAVRRP